MHENLWAPWRMKYIQGAGQPIVSGNIFVELPKLGDDQTAGILYRGLTAYVLLNAFPYTNGHLMVAPFRETNDLPSLTSEELLEINQLVARSVAWLTEAYHPDGFNIGVNVGRAAGAGIPQHLHWHVLPRWNGDTNFMSTIGQTRVMPEALEESYARLKEIVDQDLLLSHPNPHSSDD